MHSELFNLNSLRPILIFTVAPCMLIVLSPLFVQLMYTNYYKIVKDLKSFTNYNSCSNISIVAAYAATIPITSNNDM
jgi:hypothetical protein